MQRRIPAVLVCAVAFLAPAGAVAAPSHAQHQRTQTYLALGDSLAAGYQPGQGDDKTSGYVGGVYAAVKSHHPGAVLVNLACSGETAASMVAGGRCAYAEGSQLAAAVAYLGSHKAQTRVITVDVGANDVQRCVSAAGVDMACVQAGMVSVQTNLTVILGQLRSAAPQAQIVALNYYDPFLAAWLQGAPGQALAQLSVGLADTLNKIIATVASSDRVKVADIAHAFGTHTWRVVTDPTLGSVPKNVRLICAWTWMCTLGDIHANNTGYAVLARTVVAHLH